MFDPTIVIWLVLSLFLCSATWNVAVLWYCQHYRQYLEPILSERPLKRWVLGALKTLVLLETLGIGVLAIAQVIRNYYLIGVAIDVVPSWLFVVVVLQNILFFSLTTIPAVILFAYAWSLKTITDGRADRLNKSAKEYLGLERRAYATLRRVNNRGAD